MLRQLVLISPGTETLVLEMFLIASRAENLVLYETVLKAPGTETLVL